MTVIEEEDVLVGVDLVDSWAPPQPALTIVIAAGMRKCAAAASFQNGLTVNGQGPESKDTVPGAGRCPRFWPNPFST
jgi:hypothetical protein